MAPLAPAASSAGGVKTKSTMNFKHYIAAALTATLSAAVVVTVVAIALSPARIHFSITYAGSHDSPDDDGVKLLLTVAANNTSRRARVEYHNLFVDVSNSSMSPDWINWIRADVMTTLPLHQPTNNLTEIKAMVSLVGGPAALDFTHHMMTNSFAVKVTTFATFKVGFAPTRAYDIMVFCRPISFFRKGRPAAAGFQTVNCS